MSVDEELGLVYLPVETADRRLLRRPSARATNLFGESLVALDLKTGKRKWHYQLVHHGIWDNDIPCAPILVDITVDGQPRQGGRAADQAGAGSTCSIARPASRCGRSKSGPVEKGDVPGEWYSPTQPFSTKPPAFERQGVSIDDLIDFTPELRAEARQAGRRATRSVRSSRRRW